MLEHIYRAVEIAGGIDGMLGQQEPQMGAGLWNSKEEEEETDEQGRYSIHLKKYHESDHCNQIYYHHIVTFLGGFSWLF